MISLEVYSLLIITIHNDTRNCGNCKGFGELMAVDVLKQTGERKSTFLFLTGWQSRHTKFLKIVAFSSHLPV
jgi:hypothetical protein